MHNEVTTASTVAGIATGQWCVDMSNSPGVLIEVPHLVGADAPVARQDGRVS